MLFNSLHFIVFFVIVTLSYFSLKGRARWIMLLISSSYFYMAFVPAYLLILAVVILVDYVAGIWIEKTQGRKRRLILILSLIANVGFLAFFKYYNFANENLTFLLESVSLSNPIPPIDVLLPGIVLPIGLSFHTFQSMSYTIEVYRGNQKAEHDLGIYALYVLFYPQLVAGPIERPQNILWQFHKEHNYDWERIRSGLLLMAWGMFKKVVIADRLALAVDPAFSEADTANGATLALAAFFYAFQIYCDFSGYSDIAIGAGKVMGIKMMENFRTPYLSESISEFWRRWHISLSTWFRDYVYIPLGGSRTSQLRVYRNTMIIFLLSGLWHGADWKFIVWGGLHGLYILLAQMRRQLLSRSEGGAVGVEGMVRNGVGIQFANRLWTFTLVMLTWVFFRAESLSDAGLILQKMVSFASYGPVQVAMATKEIMLSLLLILMLLVFEEKWQDGIRHVTNRTFWLLFPVVVFLCYLLGVFTSNQFIYFQF